ncbi:unnamed protein product [Microthlaspi erraticum]|uniref:Gnk2-homologous domain-containing protein n=1 Tax=Microthlaspi erraticum TaxID=1685480 RepID=A0A6D2HGZ4_9BRAS|nr:unnamed protein product [Microthlaspi erraticum]
MPSFYGSVPILAVAAIQFLLLRSVSSLNLTNEYLHHKCINSQGKYNKGSVYEANLNRVLGLTSSANLVDGFSDATYGEAPNAAYLRLQCRADSYLSKCQACLSTAISELRRRCPGNKGAIIWYDQCLLRISMIHGYGKVDNENDFFLSNPKKVSGNIESFNKETSALLVNLTAKATSTSNVGSDSLVLYAAGEKMIGTKKVFAMVQCTKDFVFKSCLTCLQGILKKFPMCCNGKLGGRVLGVSCNFRYELYPFLRS